MSKVQDVKEIIQQQILLTQNPCNSADPLQMLGEVSMLHQTQDTSRKGWQNLSLTVLGLKHPE